MLGRANTLTVQEHLPRKLTAGKCHVVFSKITGKAKIQLIQCEFRKSSEMKENLGSLYHEKRNYCQLMEELNNIKQTNHESVTAH